MNTDAIHHAYNEVVATNYDLDPQGIIGSALGRGIAQLRAEGLGSRGEVEVLDIGMGTGLFLEKLRDALDGHMAPYGLDLSDKMMEFARRRLPGLTAVVGDATDLDAYFPDKTFDCICTHFVTGFVSMQVLAPQIARHLKPGGYWSLVGGTRSAYGALQAKGDSKLLRWLANAGDRRMDDTVLNPADADEVGRTMAANGLEVRLSETYTPDLDFPDFETFMEFGYRGGWLTPLIESMGLHRAGAIKRWAINRLVFPVKDKHNIVIVLGQKP